MPKKATGSKSAAIDEESSDDFYEYVLGRRRKPEERFKKPVNQVPKATETSVGSNGSTVTARTTYGVDCLHCEIHCNSVDLYEGHLKGNKRSKNYERKGYNPPSCKTSKLRLKNTEHKLKHLRSEGSVTAS